MHCAGFPKRKIRAKPNEFIRMEKERTRIKKELKTTFVSFSASRKDGARREEAQGYEIAVFFIYDYDRIMMMQRQKQSSGKKALSAHTSSSLAKKKQSRVNEATKNVGGT